MNPETEIRYQLPTPGYVTLEIYNVLGKKICTLLDKTQTAGSYAVRWDGRDELGNAVVLGIYWYQINAGEFHDVKKMLLQ